MKTKAQVLSIEDQNRTTQIFGLAMTGVFVAMLLLNAISF